MVAFDDTFEIADSERTWARVKAGVSKGVELRLDSAVGQLSTQVKLLGLSVAVNSLSIELAKLGDEIRLHTIVVPPRHFIVNGLEAEAIVSVDGLPLEVRMSLTSNHREVKAVVTPDIQAFGETIMGKMVALGICEAIASFLKEVAKRRGF